MEKMNKQNPENCYYICIDCKEMIPCIPDNPMNTTKVKEFLIKHILHLITLFTKDQLKKFSDKRFREFNYKIQGGVISVVQDC